MIYNYRTPKGRSGWLKGTRPNILAYGSRVFGLEGRGRVDRNHCDAPRMDISATLLLATSLQWVVHFSHQSATLQLNVSFVSVSQERKVEICLKFHLEYLSHVVRSEAKHLHRPFLNFSFIFLLLHFCLSQFLHILYTIYFLMWIIICCSPSCRVVLFVVLWHNIVIDISYNNSSSK